ncbi:MAG: hypothetical protein H6575_09540 [Lewinellaceae bacterium]|nr:hypothetical protein [Lewinellaceae bacterium]
MIKSVDKKKGDLAVSPHDRQSIILGWRYPLTHARYSTTPTAFRQKKIRAFFEFEKSEAGTKDHRRKRLSPGFRAGTGVQTATMNRRFLGCILFKRLLAAAAWVSSKLTMAGIFLMLLFNSAFAFWATYRLAISHEWNPSAL